MPSIPKVPFSAGDVWTPELAYLALTKPTFGGDPSVFGNWDKILDTELDDSPFGIKQRFNDFTGAQMVTQYNTTQVRVVTGTVVTPNGTFVSTIPTVLTVTTEGISLIFIDRYGNVQIGTVLPVYACLLATVYLTSGVISAVFSVPRNSTRVQARTDAIKVHGGTSLIDFTAGNGQTISGLIYCRDFLVPAGVTINIRRSARILCRNFTVTGTINVSPAAPGGQGATGTPNFNLYLGQRGSGLGGGTGGNSPVPLAYSWTEQPYGSGGASANAQIITVAGVLAIGNGGDGGGGIYVESNGIVSVTGSIFANGGAAQPSSVINGSPSAVISGASGGSGGTVTLNCINSINLSVSSMIQVNGGNAQPGVTFGTVGSSTPSSGMPGAGGQITLIAPTIVAAGTMQAGYTNIAPQLGTVGGGNSGANGGSGGGVISGTAYPPGVGTINLVYENPLGV